MSSTSESRPNRLLWSSPGFWTIVAGIALVGLALRLAFVTGHPDHPDGIRLIRALRHYDLLDFSPHFPGYPLAVALAKLFPEQGGLAWASLSAFAGAISSFVAAGLFRGPGKNGARGIGAAFIATFLPFLFLESLRVQTDVIFLPFFLATLLLWMRRRPGWAGLVLGLGLGTRPSCLPFVAGLLFAGRPWVGLAGFGMGVCLWLAPTLGLIGAEEYFQEGIRFVSGHFLDWGGTAMTHSAGRLSLILENWVLDPLRIGSEGSSFPLLGFGLVCLGGAGLVHRSRLTELPTKWRPVIASSVTYAIWMVLAQNPANPRHAIPLVMLIACALAEGLVDLHHQPRPATRRWAQATTAVLVLALVGSSVAAGRTYSTRVPPPLRSALELKHNPEFDPLLDRVYVGSDGPYYRWIGSDWSIGTVFSMNELRTDLAGLPLPPRRIWFSTEVIEWSVEKRKKRGS